VHASPLGTHLDERLGEARALGVVTLGVHRLLLNVRALLVVVVAVVVRVPVPNVQRGPARMRMGSGVM
jgi:hypothetical protein